MTYLLAVLAACANATSSVLQHQAGSGGGGSSAGLEYTFLVFLAPLVAAGLLSLAALRTYPRDVATATESARVIDRAAGPDDG